MDCDSTALERIIATQVTPNAADVDEKAMFPRAAIDALGKEGFLGLPLAKSVGGGGAGLGEAALVVEKLAAACGSTAMVMCMHYSAAAVLAKFGSDAVLKEIASGKHLTTLAFSEQGSRSHFWAPLSSATENRGKVALHAKKSWVTSAGAANSYVWSSRPLAASGASSIWLVPANSDGLNIASPFNGFGLRGNASLPIAADNVIVPRENLLGEDGQGFAIMMETVLPVFTVLSASVSIGIMSACIQNTAEHIGKTGFEQLQQRLSDLPTIRSYLARGQIDLDQARALRDDTLAAMGQGRPDTMLRVLEVKAAAGEAALRVTDTAMRICGGAAYRKELAVERCFRDARASSIMAPTSDVLYDFIGKAVSGLPLF